MAQYPPTCGQPEAQSLLHTNFPHPPEAHLIAYIPQKRLELPLKQDEYLQASMLLINKSYLLYDMNEDWMTSIV